MVAVTDLSIQNYSSALSAIQNDDSQSVSIMLQSEVKAITVSSGYDGGTNRENTADVEKKGKK